MTGDGSGRPDVTASLHALESDAVRWNDAAADLRAAAAAAADLVLGAGAFSFAGREVAAAYEALRSRTAVLLTEGADNLDAVAAALGPAPRRTPPRRPPRPSGCATRAGKGPGDRRGGGDRRRRDRAAG